MRPEAPRRQRPAQRAHAVFDFCTHSIQVAPCPCLGPSAGAHSSSTTQQPLVLATEQDADLVADLGMTVEAGIGCDERKRLPPSGDQ